MLKINVFWLNRLFQRSETIPTSFLFLWSSIGLIVQHRLQTGCHICSGNQSGNTRLHLLQVKNKSTSTVFAHCVTQSLTAHELKHAAGDVTLLLHFRWSKSSFYVYFSISPFGSEFMFCYHRRCNESAWVKWMYRVKLFSPHGGSSHICANVTAFYIQHWGAFHRLNDTIISIYRKYAIQMNNW